MTGQERKEAITRVGRMEMCFDALLAGAELDPPMIDAVLFRQLIGYYESGQWLQDYELDEQGEFPPDLKRGVLSQDAVFDFLTEWNGREAVSDNTTKKENGTMKVYGADICIDCRNYKAIQKSRGFAAEYIDITENTLHLREFLSLRDAEPVFAPVKESGGIGIPLFVREDGAKTFDINEAFGWIGQPPVREEEIVEKGFSCGENGCR